MNQYHRPPGSADARPAVLAIAAVLAAFAAPAPALERIVATFDVTHTGARVGKIEWEIDREPDGRIDFRTVNQTVGLARLIRNVTITARSTGRIIDGGYRSDRYRYRRTGDKRAQTIDARFDWPGTELTIERDDQTDTASLSPPVVDELGHLLALGEALARDEPSPSFRVLRRHKVRDYSYTLLGTETLETPLGTFEAVKLRRQRAGNKRETTIWSVPALRYLPVRIAHRENDKHVEVRLATWSLDEHAN